MLNSDLSESLFSAGDTEDADACFCTRGRGGSAGLLFLWNTCACAGDTEDADACFCTRGRGGSAGLLFLWNTCACAGDAPGDAGDCIIVSAARLCTILPVGTPIIVSPYFSYSVIKSLREIFVGLL